MSTSLPVAEREPTTATLDRAVLILYLTSLALLPWAWFPPFPWLHEHAQWSDPVFAATAVCWCVARWRGHRWPRLGPSHFAIGAYLVAASLSFLFSSSHEAAGGWKLLGIAELCALAVITADLASEPRVLRDIARVLAITALLVAAAAISGLFLFYVGQTTRLTGIYGELIPSRYYARVQAGFYNPNLLASFCIFAAATVDHREADLPVWLRRLALAALWITAGLTFSRGIIGFSLAAIIGRAHTRPRRLVAATCAVAGIGVMALLTFCKLSLDPAHPFQAHIVRSTSSSRYQALTTSLESIAKHPVLGTGPDTHPGRYFGNPFDSHMTYVGIGATLGLPALAASIWMVFAAWRSRRHPTDLARWGAMAGLAVDGLGQDIESFRHLWLLLGFIVGDAAGSQLDRISWSGAFGEVSRVTATDSALAASHCQP